MSEGEVRLIRVKAGVLQYVRIQLGVETDSTPFLPKVEQVAAGVCDPLDRLAQLRPAVASPATEDVAGKALTVWPHERHCCRARVDGARPRPGAEAERQMLSTVDQIVEGVDTRGRGVPIGEPQRHRDLRTDRCLRR